jgi:hypothetical protein
VTAAIPPFPEAALRAVLAAAVAAWQRSGEPASAGDEPRRWYVDAFAGAEFQFGTGVLRDTADPARATAAVRALGDRAMAVLVEEDPAHLQRLYAELEDAAGGERLRATRDLASLAAGEVSLVEAPFAAVAAEVARAVAGGAAFVFLAPPAARALPWEALRPLAALPDATLLVRLPFSDFEKQSRYDTPVADLPGFAKRIVEGCSAMLGDPRHAWLPAWRAAAMRSGGPAAAMDGVLERFGALLTDTAAGRIVKPVVMEMEDGAKAWLFLVTPDPAVAMAVERGNGPAASEDAAPSPEPEPVPAPVDEAASPPITEAAPPAAKKPGRGAAKPVLTEEPASPPPEPAPPAAEPSVEVPAAPRPLAVPLDLFPEDLGPPDEVILPLPPDPARPRQKGPAKPRRKKAPDTGWFGEE